ncbi:aminotransferase class I/II-fold pyridoxal phosphate-dependent enzyme [Pseudovibrio ascidiaceicola]|uniref:aminotransferase class I/II-fold pyridoxal phosphate-dependent enzyme n=1 Tax=Pseudovibrio ascidiaceicola TaxID=285279 RepID=UPI003D366F66
MPFSLPDFCQTAQHQRTPFNLEKFIDYRGPQLEVLKTRPKALQHIDKCIQHNVSKLNLSNYNIKAITELETTLREMNNLPESCSIMLGSGINTFLEELSLAFAKGRSVLLPEFDYFLFDITLEKLSIQTNKFKLTNGGHWDTADALEMLQEHNSALILLSSPNNPTSRTAPLELVETLATHANGLVIIDEVYHLFANDPHALCHLLETHENLVLLRSMSKAGYAATGFGYVMGNTEIIKCLKQLKGGTTISPLNVAAGKAMIENHDLLASHVRSCSQWRDHVKNTIEQNTALSCLPSETDFLLIETPAGQSDAFTVHLIEAGIPCISYAPMPQLTNYIRVMPASIPDADTLSHLLQKLNKLAEANLQKT